MEMRSHGKLSSDLLNLEISLWQDPSVVWLRACGKSPRSSLDPASPPLQACTHALNTQRGYLNLLCRLALIHSERI